MTVVVIGGGVIGLSIAYRLAKNGLQVKLLEAERIGTKSSWAGAGIIPPAIENDPRHALEKLAWLSNRLHPQWSRELREMTGIDNEYLPCGGICLARTAGEKAALAGQSGLWEEQGVRFRELSIEQLLEREPALNGDRIPDKTRAVEVPDESQVRNPRHLSALTTACRILGVELCEFSPVRKIQPAEDQVNVRLDDHVVSAKQVCITCGAWTTPLVKEFSRVQVVPIKGHILLFKLDQPPFQRIINEANRYVVCRKDGHVLVGSSEEETGWDDSANPAELDRLRQFAQSICVQLNEKTYVRAWTGLRPMAFDQVPYVGRHSVHTNVWFATGHYRAGLQLSTGTADLVSRMILGQNLPFDPNELRPER